MNWLNLEKEKQRKLFRQLSHKTGIPPQAIEKDAWVTLVLKMIFNLELSEQLIFKGGTSLSKCYELIERFSEDIDIAINREFLGFGGDLTKGQIRKLRRKSHDFVSNTMINLIRKEFDKHEINSELYLMEVENIKISDQDPEIIKISYNSVFEELSYIPGRVLIEIGARSLMEPIEYKEICSIIDKHYPESSFSQNSFLVRTVIPDKTFLEKLILLHEEFTKPIKKIRYHRMSRHLYDIGQILYTEYGKRALKNEELFQKIINHRKIFTPIKSVDYSGLSLNNLKIIPRDEVFDKYKKDYIDMQENMIYGENLDFSELLKNIQETLSGS